MKVTNKGKKIIIELTEKESDEFGRSLIGRSR